jgi:hypothetical protein
VPYFLAGNSNSEELIFAATNLKKKVKDDYSGKFAEISEKVAKWKF